MSTSKDQLTDHNLVIGFRIEFGNLATSEGMTRAGFEWLDVDLEPSSLLLESVSFMEAN